MSWTGYVGTTKRLKLDDLALNGTAVTTLGGGESVVWELLNAAGTVVDTGVGVHSSGGDWYADVELPATAGRYRIRWTVTKGGSVEFFLGDLWVRAVQ
jgi:hypothetical protein